MSSEWQTKPLGEIVSFKTGKLDSNASEDDGKYPFFTCSPITLSINSFAFDTEALILAGNNANGVFSTKHYSGKFNAYQRTYIIEPLNVAEVSCKYIYFTVSHMVSHLKELAIGTSTKFLTKTILNGLTIQLPPKTEQDKIAALLSSLDDRIALLRETNATLEAIAQALFKSWFVDFDPVHAKQQGIVPEGMDEATAALLPDGFEESALGLVPKGWKVSRLGDVVERITKGTTPTTLKRPFVAAGINFVKAESMTGDGDFIPEKFAFIDNETHELLRRSQLAAGDVLISIAGTIGRIAVITEDFIPANTNQAVALIRPFQDRFPSGLVSRFLQKSESRQLMVERVVQAVQANLSLGSLSDLKLAIPSPEVTMQLYETGLAQLDASKASNHQRIRTLATLRDTLLPRLISGQLRLPDAEVMLEAVE
jgi:type I restriction enzyme, S subunit